MTFAKQMFYLINLITVLVFMRLNFDISCVIYFTCARCYNYEDDIQKGVNCITI
jgi:hypothetical protein